MRFAVFAIALLGLAGQVQSAAIDSAAIDSFVAELAQRDGFDPRSVRALIDQAAVSDAVLNAISKPAEAKPWYKYRPIFITPERIDAGVAFWRANAASLERARAELGVPPEVICAIIGVETFYGRNTGSFRVMDALTTLAFAYPPRSDFFRKELRAFLLLQREQELEPFSLRGSYAGAMGLPQFMPSSYLAYAIDFDGDGHTDIWSNATDAIGSVANYLHKHGWVRDEPVTAPTRVAGEAWREVAKRGLKPELSIEELTKLGIHPQDDVPRNLPAALVELEGEQGNEYWLGMKNFYAITRYNRSPLYAMAVHQLSQAIRAGYEQR